MVDSFVAEPEFLCLVRQFLKCLLGIPVHRLFVGEDVFPPDTAMGPDLPMRDSALLQELDKKRTGEVQKVGGLIGSQFVRDGCDVDGMPVSHLGQRSCYGTG